MQLLVRIGIDFPKEGVNIVHRKCFLIAGLVVCGCFLASCSSVRSNVPAIDQDSAQQIDRNNSMYSHSDSIEGEMKEDIFMSASVDETGCLFITIENNSDSVVEMGQSFTLQKKENETWIDTPLPINDYDVLNEIDPGQSHTLTYDIGNVVTLEKGGQYQIEQMVSIGQKAYIITATLRV